HVAQAAQHHKHQNQDGGVEVELIGHHGGVVHGKQGARRARQGGGGDEGHELVFGDVDAHALGGNAVVPHGHNSPAGAAVHQVKDHKQGDEHQDKAGGKGGYGHV